MARLTDMLEPGERVLHRVVMPADAAAIIVLWAVFVGGTAADKLYRYPPDTLGGTLYVIGVFILPAIFGDRLFVKLRGEEVQLHVEGKTAERILAAIAAAKEATA